MHVTCQILVHSIYIAQRTITLQLNNQFRDRDSFIRNNLST